MSGTARWWMLTIKHEQYVPYLPPGINYIKGQLEQGTTTGYIHWQVVCNFKQPVRLAAVKKIFGDSIHAEKTKSDKALDYVWKDETSIENTRFELGDIPLKRNDATDWERVYSLAVEGQFTEIPKDILVRCYGNIKTIRKDNLRPTAVHRTVHVFWGPTGTGKSHRAWELAGWDAFPKDPCTKFWDGYQDHNNVVIDEFRGDIGISHVLRWFDKYPVIVEAKHGACCLRAENIYITSNLDPRNWYPNIDDQTRDALIRRLSIVRMELRFVE